MRHLAKRVSCMALLAASGVFMGTAHRAEGGLGIIVTDSSLMPISDPKTQLTLSLSLVSMNELSPADPSTMTPADNITIHNFPGFSGVASYNFVFSSFFTISSTSAGPGLSNIILSFTPPTSQSFANATPSDFPIGQLVIQTTFDFSPTGYAPLLMPITYTTQTHSLPSGALNTGTGTFTPQAVVPEPSSIALTAIGLAAARFYLARRRGSRSPGRVGGDPPAGD